MFVLVVGTNRCPVAAAGRRSHCILEIIFSSSSSAAASIVTSRCQASLTLNCCSRSCLWIPTFAEAGLVDPRAVLSSQRFQLRCRSCSSYFWMKSYWPSFVYRWLILAAQHVFLGCKSQIGQRECRGVLCLWSVTWYPEYAQYPALSPRGARPIFCSLDQSTILFTFQYFPASSNIIKSTVARLLLIQHSATFSADLIQKWAETQFEERVEYFGMAFVTLVSFVFACCCSSLYIWSRTNSSCRRAFRWRYWQGSNSRNLGWVSG